MLNYRADIRSVLYMIANTALFVGFWVYGFNWIAYAVYLILAVSVSVMTHNHQHLNMWKSKTMNILTDWWLTVFYGVPVFNWIPTHNKNHHRFNNKEGDSSLTYRHTEENNFMSLLSYPTVSGYHQIVESIIPYMKDLKKTNRTEYILNWVQIFILAAWIIGFLIYDWKRALIYVIIPQQVSAFVVLIFNYLQHVHTDEESKYNHSRNFLGLNWILFNNGYHTAHHERAGIHWSLIGAEHEKIKHLIDPHLIQPSMLIFIFKTYILGSFSKKYRTSSMRLQRIETQNM